MNIHEMVEVCSILSGIMLTGDLREADKDDEIFGCTGFVYPVRQRMGSVDCVAIEIRVFDAQKKYSDLLKENERYVFECRHFGQDIDEYIIAIPFLTSLPPMKRDEQEVWKKMVRGIFMSELERLQDRLDSIGIKTYIDKA